jgi:endonuclease/exonuclease/phosphatase family metal-dependent hydrolase
VGTTRLNGLVMWSRYPLARVQSVPLAYGGEVVDVLEVPRMRAPVRVFAAHPISPRWTMGPAWAADESRLVAAAAKLPDQSLIVGDLNMTRDHAPYRKLLALGFLDALDVTASGWQPTWSLGPGNLGLATIDHVLGRGVGFSDYETLGIAGSDHHAVVVTVTVPRALG